MAVSHDHGPAFAGCSKERHALLRDGKPGEPPEARAGWWNEWTDLGICLCCGEQLGEPHTGKAKGGA